MTLHALARRWRVIAILLVPVACGDDGPTAMSTDGSSGSGTGPGSETGALPSTGDPSDTEGADSTTTVDEGSSSGDENSTGGPQGASMSFLLRGVLESGSPRGIYRFDLVDGIVGEPVPIATDISMGRLSSDQTMLLVGYDGSTTWQMIPLVDGEPGAAVPVEQPPAPMSAGVFSPRFVGGTGISYVLGADPGGADLRLFHSSTDGTTVDPPEILMEQQPAGDVFDDVTFSVSGDRFAVHIDPVGDTPRNWWLGSAAVADPGGLAPLSDLDQTSQNILASNRAGFLGEDLFIYLADRDIDEVFELFAVDLSGPMPAAPQRIHPPLTPTEYLNGPNRSRQGDRLMYWQGELPPGGDVFMVEITGGNVSAPVQLSTLGDGEVRGSFGWSPDGRWAYYWGRHMGDGTYDLYLVDVAGPVPGTPTLVYDGPGLPSASPPRFSLDSHWLYHRELLDTDVDEIFRLDVSGDTPGDIQSVSGLPPEGQQLGYIYTIAEGGGGVIYTLREEDVTQGIYLVDTSGDTPAEPITVAEGAPGGWELGQITDVAPDASVVLYYYREEGDFADETHVFDVATGTDTMIAVDGIYVDFLE